ncbi:hypothetical protein [Metakosakonia massiliensis]|uniref:Uncharacterized protein n=1 Tax=Phytobacter massiliensis TaxID=1485952 RepID=A0A6N3AEJ5_9ENTR
MIRSISEVKLFKEPGISTDINVILSENKNIQSFSISSDDDGYFVDINLINKTKKEIEHAFDMFVSFMKYSHMVCYQKHIRGENIIYEFITANEQMRGFFCQLSFN